MRNCKLFELWRSSNCRMIINYLTCSKVYMCSNRQFYISLVLRENSQGWHDVWGCSRKYCGHKKLPQKWSRENTKAWNRWFLHQLYIFYTLKAVPDTPVHVYDTKYTGGHGDTPKKIIVTHYVEEIGWHIIERNGGIEKVWLPPLKPTEMCINADNDAACRG